MQKYEYRNIDEKYAKRAAEIAETFKPFTFGYRVMFLLQRHKDGGHTNNSKLRMYITRSTEEWIDALGKLLQEKADYPEIALRIYQTLNSRDIEKSIRTMKQNQLDADYYDTESRVNFYIDIKNRWVSALMAPGNRAERNFLVDVDTLDPDLILFVDTALKALTEIIAVYDTKKGVHFIVKPFNHTKFPKTDCVEVKTDAMMLLAY